MKENDSIQDLFNRLEGDFDCAQTPNGHEKRFLARLQAQVATPKRRFNWWKPLSIAASIALLVTLGINNFSNEQEEISGLAGVSPELEQTQSFFVTAINQEVAKLKSLEDVHTKRLIDDALSRLSDLEANYEQLKTDLIESGNDKRVIAAMIANFQNRIAILEQVITTIEEIKTLKANEDETII